MRGMIDSCRQKCRTTDGKNYGLMGQRCLEKRYSRKMFQKKCHFRQIWSKKKHHLRVFENVSPHPLPYLKFFFLKHWVKSNKVLVEVSILNFFLITETIFSICPICPKMSPKSRNKSVKRIFCLFSIVFPD